MVYGVVKQSGGYIDVTSEPGRGLASASTCREWVLRLIPAQAELCFVPGRRDCASGQGQPFAPRTHGSFVGSCGYTVLEANNGEHALEVSDEQKHDIHLLLTDVVMPGISGRVLAEELAKRRPLIRVLYMSGYTGQTVGAHGGRRRAATSSPNPSPKEDWPARCGKFSTRSRRRPRFEGRFRFH